MKQPLQSSSRPSGLIWVNCLHSMVTVGLMRIMEEQAWVHTGRETPEAPSSVILCVGVDEGLSENLERLRQLNPAASILVFASHLLISAKGAKAVNISNVNAAKGEHTIPGATPSYPPEFKREAARLVRSSPNRSVAQIARELGVSDNSLRSWVKQTEIDQGEREGLSTEEREELSKLR